jgi:P27 family predicted phage terminase small subunit
MVIKPTGFLGSHPCGESLKTEGDLDLARGLPTEANMKGRKPVIKPLGDDYVVDLPSAIDRMPEPPERLKGLARELWPSVVGELVVRNIYAGDCRDAAMAYCSSLPSFLKLRRILQSGGKTMQSGVYTVPNASLKISDATCDRMLRIGAELGLSAASRKRVTKVRGGAMQAPAQKFLKRAT